MYKQKCVGSRGPLIPILCVLLLGWTIYSIGYTGVLYFGWNVLAAVAMAAFYGWCCYLVWRYTRVNIEYTWLSGELVIRCGKRLGNRRVAIRKENMFGFHERGRQLLGRADYNCRKQNFCATFWGRLIGCCILYCNDYQGKPIKIYFQPSDELREMLIEALKAEIKKESKSA